MIDSIICPYISIYRGVMVARVYLLVVQLD